MYRKSDLYFWNKIFPFFFSFSLGRIRRRSKKKRACLDTEMIRSDYMMIVCKLFIVQSRWRCWYCPLHLYPAGLSLSLSIISKRKKKKNILLSFFYWWPPEWRINKNVNRKKEGPSTISFVLRHDTRHTTRVAAAITQGEEREREREKGAAASLSSRQQKDIYINIYPKG
jgi:hypothetical protein